MNILEVRKLRTEFHTDDGVVQAVRGIDFEIGAGESIGVVGESGCGKSVTMLSIMRLLGESAHVTADSICFDGIELPSLDKDEMRRVRGREIGMIFQDPMTSLNPVYTIGNQVMEPLRIHMKMSPDKARKRAMELMELVGIADVERRMGQYPHEFSGGMRQRVMIAIAMSCNPKLLIADEPTTALDVTIQAQILDLMRGLKDSFNMSIALITHDLGVIASMCSRVLVMYAGLIVEQGSIEDIFYHPAHPYTEGLLQSLPKPREGREKLYSIPGNPPDLISPPVGCPFVLRCDRAMRICMEHMPPLTALEGGHKSACWLLHERAAVKNKRHETASDSMEKEKSANTAGDEGGFCNEQ